MVVAKIGLAAGLSICLLFGQETPSQNLIVKSGEMPLYPPLLRIAQIEGDVVLRVTTDGSAVSNIAAERGPLLLTKAAQDVVRTWKFEPHTPTSFSTTFTYRLEKEIYTNSCNLDKPDNGTVVLHLPTSVEITSRLTIHECPDSGLDLTEPLRVFITKCEIDGIPVACDKFDISLHSGKMSRRPTSFTEPDRRQGFTIPPEFRNLKTFDIRIDTGHGSLYFPGQDIHFLRGNWRIGVDHAPFKDDTPVYGEARNAPCVGYISFEWGEPGILSWSACK